MCWKMNDSNDQKRTSSARSVQHRRGLELCVVGFGRVLPGRLLGELRGVCVGGCHIGKLLETFRSDFENEIELEITHVKL